MFLELMKQPYSPGRRIGTAQLIDDLSLGTCMIPSWLVMETEIRRFLLHAKGESRLHSVQELIWTKIPYVLGDVYPSIAKIFPDDELVIQKSFFDFLWARSLSDMVRIAGDSIPPVDDFAELSRNTNEKNLEHKDELHSFAQTYDIELRGAIEIAGDMAADIIHQIAEKESELKLGCTPDERADTINMCRNLLYYAFKKPENKDALRCLHIGASIHAAMRWDKDRRFKPNDYYDFEHATAALSYCDAFLTEGPLHDLVTRPQVNLEAVNDCRVFSDAELATDYIRLLTSAG